MKSFPGKTKKHHRRPASGNDHPGPWRSALWKHLELIRSLRMGRHTWGEVTDAIVQAGGPRVAEPTVLNFYRRAIVLIKKGKFPLGFEDPFAGVGAKPIPSPTPATPASAPPSAEKSSTPEKPYKPGDRYRKAVLENKPKPSTFITKDNIIEPDP